MSMHISAKESDNSENIHKSDSFESGDVKLNISVNLINLMSIKLKKVPLIIKNYIFC